MVPLLRQLLRHELAGENKDNNLVTDELAKAHPKHKGVLRRAGHLAFLGHRSIVAFRNIRIAEVKQAQ